MTTTTAVAEIATRQSLVTRFAGKYGVDSDKLLNTLKSTAFKQTKDKSSGTVPEVSNEQMMALLVVANEYNLNPFTREIYAFPDPQRGGIVPIVSVDGWIRIINQHPELESIEFEYAPDESEDAWIACTIKRKDRTKPVTIREYLKECYRDTGPWNSHKRRMLRHKALIQAGRIAFGFAGIFDPDEAERIREIDVTPPAAAPAGQKPATTPPKAKATAKAKVAPVEITEVPVAELRARIDAIGMPLSEFCAHFEIGDVDELPLNQVDAAWELLNRVHGG